MRDEREQIVELHSFGFGGCVVATLVVAFLFGRHIAEDNSSIIPLFYSGTYRQACLYF